MPRIEHDRRPVHGHINTAGAVDDFEIDPDSGSHFKLVPDPEPPVWRARFTRDDRAVDLRLEVRAFDRREAPCLCKRRTTTQH